MLISTIWAFDNIENKNTLCPGEECMKKFYKSLTEHATTGVNFEKKKKVTINKKRVKVTPSL